MKKIIVLCLVLLTALFACQKEADELINDPTLKSVVPTEQIDCSNYPIGLINYMNIYDPVANTSTYKYVVNNTNPGNGDNGTSQDILHFSLEFSADCPDGASILDYLDVMVAGYYEWDPNIFPYGDYGPFQPIDVIYEPDPSVPPGTDCSSGSVLKFDVPTTGTDPVKFTFTVPGYFPPYPDALQFNFKAGTGCCSNLMMGPLCREDEEALCLYSQGLFFRSSHAWPQESIIIGGFEYTEAALREVVTYNPKKGGITDAQKAIRQEGAIILSDIINPGILDDPILSADVAIIDDWLTSLGKPLTVDFLPKKAPKEVLAAAERLSEAIENDHCSEDNEVAGAYGD